MSQDNEAAKPKTAVFTIITSLGGIFIALLMLLGVFNYLNSIGLPTGIISFLMILIGVFSLGSAGSENQLASFFIILIGLFLFADALQILGSGQARWLWPLFIVLFALLLLIYKSRPKKAKI